jgi:hypothetical protein
MSVSIQGLRHCLFSYYKTEDIEEGRLQKPSNDDSLRQLKPRCDLVNLFPGFLFANKMEEQARGDEGDASSSPNSRPLFRGLQEDFFSFLGK